MAVSVVWVRRDLRMRDHPALTEAAAAGDTVLPLFVLDPRLVDGATPRRDHLLASLRALDEAMDGGLVVRRGRPEQVVARVAEEVGAETVHVTAESTPYGRSRDQRVRDRLERDGRSLVATGTPYAVGPGTLTKADGTPYQVFTPFSKAWRAHGWPAPPPCRAACAGLGPTAEGIPPSRTRGGAPAGEEAARRRWKRLLDRHLGDYDAERDRPDLDGDEPACRCHLKYGELHPRTLLADLAAPRRRAARRPAPSASELAWREFYADVLWHHPTSALGRPQAGAVLAWSTPTRVDRRCEAWREGRDRLPDRRRGDAPAARGGLDAQPGAHDRRASFLVKDLHVWWPHGARHFLDHLRDGDLASNSHGWQWVAGTGTDAAPYFRVFNPVTQGLKFDPDGDYVRRWVPELRHLPGKAAHQPWEHDDGYAEGYPERIVDHKEEREEALRRYQATRG